MATKNFAFRLQSQHRPADAKALSLVVEFKDADGAWKGLEPSLETPGFRMYLLSLFLCQHFYLVANAAERSLPLARVEGGFEVVTAEDWIIQSVKGDFSIRLDPAQGKPGAGAADQATLDYIKLRMQLCPVSRNLPSGVIKETLLRAVQA